jgi:hypothetical protein
MPLVRIDISKTASRERVGRRPSRISSTAAADVQILRLRRTLKTDPRAPSIIRAECDVGHVFVLPPCCPDLSTKTVDAEAGLPVTHRDRRKR